MIFYLLIDPMKRNKFDNTGYIMDIDNKIEKSYQLIEIVGNSAQKTLYFKIDKKDIRPGNFFMLNYNCTQKPFSVSSYDGEVVGFTIQDRGECSKKMINSKAGDFFGLTGPLGNNFDVSKSKNVLLIGGGIGSAPIKFLAETLINMNISFSAYFGARNVDLLKYLFDLDKKRGKIKYYTDDGSYGIKGFVTDDLDKVLKTESFDSIYLCGPEKMMAKTIEIVGDRINNIQISMERYMKCGVGICGSCVLDDISARVCEDGPVFSYFDTIVNCREFGKYHRNGLGIIEK